MAHNNKKGVLGSVRSRTGVQINFLAAKSGHLHYILNIKEYYNIFQFYSEKKSVRGKVVHLQIAHKYILFKK